VDRVVAVAATLRDGREQIGSGYLLRGRLVLTAEHCTRDGVTGAPAAQLRVVRASDGAVTQVAGMVADRGLDVAVLRLADSAPWDAGLPPPAFARVDQSQAGVLDDCTGIGFPLFQRDPAQRTRHTSEFHGTVYQTDERESGHLLMREPLIHPGPVISPGGAAWGEQGEQGLSPWGGLSGALMFYRGRAIGVVVEHHSRQGDSALRAIGFERVAAVSAEIRQALGLPEPDGLPWASEQAAARALLAGWPLAQVKDPFALEVHRPVQAEDPHDDLPVLPAYVPREHDAELARVVRAAADGRGGIAVLVGGSSTGKTRACWEALQLLRNQEPGWRLWHPIDPTRPDAALRELPGIGPRTVVWLNDAQFYLDVAEGGLGERVAAGLRELLRDPARAPVLMLATLWPQFWDGLTARPAGDDPHAQARQLLAGHDITVPAAFTPAQLQRLAQAGDARLALAAAAAQDRHVIQFLAGASELLARYRNAPAAVAALINAAMDARRLGMGISLPQAFLEAAAPGYLTDTEWDALDENWLEQAFAYVTVPSKGIRGPLTRIRARPARSRLPGPGPGNSDEQRVGGRASIAGMPLYRLADYLDQHGRAHRVGQIPPAEFWAAAAAHAAPGDGADVAAEREVTLRTPSQVGLAAIKACAVPVSRKQTGRMIAEAKDRGPRHRH
jgi:Trypsin-like peptidase domain